MELLLESKASKPSFGSLGILIGVSTFCPAAWLKTSGEARWMACIKLLSGTSMKDVLVEAVEVHCGSPQSNSQYEQRGQRAGLEAHTSLEALYTTPENVAASNA